jgi:hypothetical protein
VEGIFSWGTIVGKKQDEVDRNKRPSSSFNSAQLQSCISELLTMQKTLLNKLGVLVPLGGTSNINPSTSPTDLKEGIFLDHHVGPTKGTGDELRYVPEDTVILARRCRS